MSIAFMFPGQGAQYVGMGKEMYQNFESARKIFDTASESLGIDMKQMIFEGDEDTLKITENTQPAILTTSIACYQVLKEHGVIADIVAGLSLGEYTSHVVSGSINFADSVKLVKKRGKYMQEAVPPGVGTMAAILGLDNEEIDKVCQQASDVGIVEPANYNCPGQVVISGEVSAVEKALKVAQLNNAKTAQLEVSAPFHCSMLKSAGEKLKNELQNIDIFDMNIPVISNVTGEIIKDKSDIKELLINQVSMPVNWEKSIRTMLDNEVTTFVEVGPGKVLSGFVKKVDRKLNTLNVENMKTLEKALKKLENN